jgi:hypothetical protein
LISNLILLLCCLVLDLEILIWPEVKETIVYTFQITSRNLKIYFKHCMIAFNWWCKADAKVFCYVNPKPNKLLFLWIKLSILNILNYLALMLLEFSKISIIFCFNCRINNIILVFQKLFPFWIRNNIVCNLLVFRKKLPTICKYIYIDIPYTEDMCRVWKCIVKTVHKS